MSYDDQQRKNKQKWRVWNQQRERAKAKQKVNLQEGIQNYAVNIAQKISAPSSKNINNQLNKKMGNQIESNICSICLQLMIPPTRHPMILFPCGHNICKDCLFQHPPQGQIKKNLKLKLQKCCICRQKIQSYALNHSLMTLICTYTDNKQLLQKQRQRLSKIEQQGQDNHNLSQLKIRCNILQKQQESLNKQSLKYGKQKAILGEVIETLKKEKKRNEKEMQKLQQQAKLITGCLTQKIEELQMLQKRLKDINDKSKVVEKALMPIKKEKEKQQLLEIAKIIQKG